MMRRIWAAAVAGVAPGPAPEPEPEERSIILTTASPQAVAVLLTVPGGLPVVSAPLDGRWGRTAWRLILYDIKGDVIKEYASTVVLRILSATGRQIQRRTVSAGKWSGQLADAFEPGRSWDGGSWKAEITLGLPVGVAWVELSARGTIQK